MEWSARMAALELHSGLDLNQQTGVVLAYFQTCLQAAYDAGKAEHASKQHTKHQMGG